MPCVSGQGKGETVQRGLKKKGWEGRSGRAVGKIVSRWWKEKEEEAQAKEKETREQDNTGSYGSPFCTRQKAGPLRSSFTCLPFIRRRDLYFVTAEYVAN